MSQLVNAINNDMNVTVTLNGAVTPKTTESSVLDYFSKGSALRTSDENTIIKLFSLAFAEDRTLALKALFYSRDIRGK